MEEQLGRLYLANPIKYLQPFKQKMVRWVVACEEKTRLHLLAVGPDILHRSVNKRKGQLVLVYTRDISRGYACSLHIKWPFVYSSTQSSLDRLVI